MGLNHSTRSLCSCHSFVAFYILLFMVCCKMVNMTSSGHSSQSHHQNFPAPVRNGSSVFGYHPPDGSSRFMSTEGSDWPKRTGEDGPHGGQTENSRADSNRQHTPGNKLYDTQHDSNKDVEIVIPYQVDHQGSYLSHKLSSHRWKRNSGVIDSISGAKHHSIYINITGFRQTFHLKLVPNKQLLAPGFKVYRRSFSGDLPARLNEMDEETTEDDTCLYSGWVLSHGGEPVAVSLCRGVEGLLRTPSEDFVIEPLKETVFEGDQLVISHPHRMYRQAALHHHKGGFGGEAIQDKIVSRTFGGHPEKVTRNGITVDITTSVADRDKRSLFKWLLFGKQRERVVELLAVADKTMLQIHGKHNVTTYVLTIFNMVSQLFQDSSIGVPIRVVLVGLVILENDQPGLLIKHHADKTLNSFCTWQAVLGGKQGRQHDHAVLLTSTDICSNKEAPCDTLGFAPIGGMCNRLRSCTVNEDSGLITAFTIAHEMGHNFGMYHDGDGNFCKVTRGSIMAPALQAKDGRLKWSVCSRAYLLRFLNTVQARCLDNIPKKSAELQFPEKLPGVLYNADIQCKWQFDNIASYCPYEFGRDICKVLWCYQGNQRCETKFLPAAEGTSCGASKWCRGGKCVKFGEEGPKPIQGGWSPWSRWTECSRSCGGGTRFKERLCNKPLAQYGGRKCLGPSKIHKMCNTEACLEGETDMAVEQCRTYNSKPFQGWLLQWTPNIQLYKSTEPCKMFCKAQTRSYIFTLKLAAVDGVRCKSLSNEICVEGTCQGVGCDGIVGSNARIDACGECRGDNSTCKMITGEFSQQPPRNSYFPIVVLPKEAKTISIREKKISVNYLAIRNIYGQYYLNGQRNVAWPGVYKFGGTEFVYKRPYNDVETLSSQGPLLEDLVLEILVQGENTGVEYEYALDKSSEELTRRKTHTYSWSVSVSACSEPCATGQKTVKAVCHRDYQEEVNPGYCDQTSKPETGVFSCNLQPCRARWEPGEWGLCSRSCGGGKQRRKLKCVQKIQVNKDRKLKRKHCYHQQKPVRKRRCNLQECPPSWHAGKWTKCSVTCGRGEKKRKIVCRSRSASGYHKLPDNMCPSSSKPSYRQTCSVLHCPLRFKWKFTKWTKCSQSCGRGVRTRALTCVKQHTQGHNRTAVEERYCQHLKIPNRPLTSRCHERPCSSALRVVPSWYTHTWSACSVTCGSGILRRVVECKDPLRQVSTTGCVQSAKPTHVRSCWMGECPIKREDPFCVDQYKWCHLVLQHKMCADGKYGGKCCRTCRGR